MVQYGAIFRYIFEYTEKIKKKLNLLRYLKISATPFCGIFDEV